MPKSSNTLKIRGVQRRGGESKEGGKRSRGGVESKCTLRLWGCFVRFVCFDCVSNPLRACGRLWVLMPACVILACLGVCCFLDAFSRRFGPVLPRLRGFFGLRNFQAAIAQLGERQTEDLKVPGSIPGLGNFSYLADSGVSKAGCGLLLFRPGLCSSFCRSLDCHLSMARPHPGGAQKLRTPGVEPGSQAWGACMMPLHYVRC